ncbi:hypothetical protein [Bordetella sp. N]|uniref:hypothetical protein n=1 Tax=Bordetella sp. N TaxID=1746199 RepID=UPI00070B10B0|nr:hypothetical protein [Bordetella sp. N]ALM81884.1 hypothetical protein ASB57_01910 [Bordetella sp. N]
MTLAAQQFSTPFSHDFSGSIAGTFGSIAGTAPTSVPGRQRPRGRTVRSDAGRGVRKFTGKFTGRVTGKWPFRPAEPQDQTDPAIPVGHVSSVARGQVAGQVTVREMVTDVLLVGMWGAMIPGLMWLGSALGF